MTFCVCGNKSHVDIFTPTSLDQIRSTNNTAEDPNNFLPLCQFPPGISGTSQVFLHMLMHGSPAS